MLVADPPFPQGTLHPQIPGTGLGGRGGGSRGAEQARLSQPLLSSGQVLAGESPAGGVSEARRLQRQVAPTGRNLPLHPLLAGKSLGSQCPPALAHSGHHPETRGPSPEEEEHGPASPPPPLLSRLGRTDGATCQEKKKTKTQTQTTSPRFL